MSTTTLTSLELLTVLKQTDRYAAFRGDFSDEDTFSCMQAVSFPGAGNLPEKRRHTFTKVNAPRLFSDAFKYDDLAEALLRNWRHAMLHKLGDSVGEAHPTYRGKAPRALRLAPRLEGWRAWLALLTHLLDACPHKAQHPDLSELDLPELFRAEEPPAVEPWLERFQVCCLRPSPDQVTESEMIHSEQPNEPITAMARIANWSFRLKAFGKHLVETGHAILAEHALPDTIDGLPGLLEEYQAIVAELGGDDDSLPGPSRSAERLNALLARQEAEQDGRRARMALEETGRAIAATLLRLSSPHAAAQSRLEDVRRAAGELLDSLEHAELADLQHQVEAVAAMRDFLGTADLGLRVQLGGTLSEHGWPPDLILTLMPAPFEESDASGAKPDASDEADAPPSTSLEAPDVGEPADPEPEAALAPTPEQEPAEPLLEATSLVTSMTLAIPAAKPQSAAPPAEPVSQSPPPEAAAAPCLPTEGAQHHEERLWSLLERGRSALAFQLALAGERLDAHSDTLLSAPLLRALTLSPRVRFASGEIVQAQKEDFLCFQANALAVAPDDQHDAVSILWAAAALRPAIIAPETGAAAILRAQSFRDGLPDLYAYCQTLASFGEQQHGLDPSLLKKVKSQAAWEADLKSLRDEAETWRQNAFGFTMTYVPAVRVWRAWLSEGPASRLLDPIRKGQVADLDGLRLETERLGDSVIIDAEINETDRRLRPRRGEEIIARARQWLYSRLAEAVTFAKRWIELAEGRPGQSQGYRHQQAEVLRQKLHGKHEAAIAELEQLAMRRPTGYLPVAARIGIRAIEGVRDLFDPDVPMPNDEPSLQELLRADLLLVPDLDLHDDWSAACQPGELVETLGRLAEEEPDWLEAFRAHCDRRNLQAAHWVLAVMGAEGDVLAEELRRREQECRQALRRDLDATVTQIEHEVAYGLLKESDRGRYLGRIEAIERVFTTTLRFGEKRRELEELRSEIKATQSLQIESVRQRLTLEGLKPDHPAYERILGALAEGDISSANEYIDMAKKNQPIPEPAHDLDLFGDFFPQRFRELSELLEKRSASEIVRLVKRREVSGLDMGRVSGAQASQASEMLEAWYTLKRSGTFEEGAFRRLLSELGFEVQSLACQSFGQNLKVSLAATPFGDRHLCPVPQYGSSANGRYALLCAWRRPSEEDLVNDIAKLTHEAPVVVLYFGRLTEKSRREIARLCRERRRTAIVIDEALLLYLCGVRGSRLPVLFACSLPFTVLEPYVTTGSTVPPEMFYGRERERDAIMDRFGSCFIYGGRQLGKTALLLHVESTFHAPEQGRIARWIDLKQRGIGKERSLDELWHELVLEFKHLEVVPSRTPEHISEDRLIQHLRNWLEEDESRRILLLLDEADRFLEGDAQDEFKRVARLKGLMEDTKRRFKVVFAGLHNVQRTTRIANHPLAHFGTPICIGPLLEDGEWREARSLIELPLASLGYRFESPDLVTRILSQTNYYPSLIQLYCNQLLRHVSSHVPFDPRTCPPYTIGSKHVEDAYRSLELRSAIRERFIITLQLDKRYEVIAYAIALESLHDPAKGMIKGFSTATILKEAIGWWSEGFRDSASIDGFRALLEEMVGLGILRQSGEGHYALRSPNLITLIGNEEEIAEQLLRPRSVEDKYEATFFRSALRDRAERDALLQGLRNPLTVQQEFELRERRNGISLVLGMTASGMEDMGRFLGAAFGQEHYRQVSEVRELAQFRQHLEKLTDRSRDSVTLMYVDPSCLWTERWPLEASEWLGKLKSKSAFARLLFAADPRWALQLCRQGQVDPLAAAGISLLSLKPWHDGVLRQWLDDRALGVVSPERLKEVTGNWPLLLYRFQAAIQATPHRWEQALADLEAQLVDPERNAELLEAFGLDLPMPRQILRTLGIVGEASIEELASLVEEVPSSEIGPCMDWARHLNLVQLGDTGWRLDPIASRLLLGQQG